MNTFKYPIKCGIIESSKYFIAEFKIQVINIPRLIKVIYFMQICFNVSDEEFLCKDNFSKNILNILGISIKYIGWEINKIAK
jgi:hypothetical protein